MIDSYSYYEGMGIMGSSIVDQIRENKDAIQKEWLREMAESRPESDLTSITNHTRETTNNTFVELIFNFLFENDPKVKINGFIDRVLKFGWPLSYLTSGLQIFRRITVKQTIIVDTESHPTMENIYEEIDQLIDPIFNQLIEDATKSWENTVNIQKQALLELSAPLIPIMEGICVMPLIGTIDTERAKRIMENLLQGVIKNRAEVVLIDITGVPVVDTMVAHHVIQASEAVRLVGSKCILVGIRPEIAQTIVNLGINLGEFPTKSTLQKGMETALELTKRKIVNL